MISVLILTKNEEKDLPGCLESVSWSDDVVVYDSFSADRTVDIAEEFGARVIRRQFDNWSSHQNWGLRNIQFKYEWVFYIDADERMSPELVKSVQAAVSSPGDCVAFRIERRDFWGQTWLKRVQASSYYIRLFKPEFISYERLVNPVTIVDGKCGDVNGFLNHYPFSKGVNHWLERHNSYSSFEAQQIVESELHAEASFLTLLENGLTVKDFNQRRSYQKALFYRLPARPVVKFLLFYVIRMGFLDGVAGLRYSILQSIYEYMIVLKVKEMNSGLDRAGT